MSDLELVQFADNPDPRAPCLLLLDTSASMNGAKIRALNEGLELFARELRADPLASRRVEVAVVTFGRGGVEVAADFATVDAWDPPRLAAGGSTPLGAGLERALELLVERKALYKRAGAQYYRPWLFLITDGEPTDGYREAGERARAEDDRKGVLFFAVGVEPANMERLAEIAPAARPPLKLSGLHFAELFQWLSQSQQRVSHSRVGDQLALPPIGWADVET